jgi:outer membrane receptor protein involved in Fe transport
MNFRNALFLGSVSALALGTAAMAQDQAVEEVVVTGSRVITNSTMSPTPLTVVSTDQLKTISSGTIPDALNKLPVFQGSSSQRNTGNSSGNASGNVVSLRNFGANRTLVLLDGHRVAGANSAGTANIDNLPQMLLERVDVVTGGASAVYGSDAITGVVNFILDKDFSGLKFDSNLGISQAGEGFRHQVGVAVGTGFAGGRGHVEASARIFHQNKVLMRDLPYGPETWLQVGNNTAANPSRAARDTRNPAYSIGGVITCRPANTAGCATLNGNLQFVGNGVVGPFTHGSASGTAGLELGGDGAYASTTTAQAELRSNEGFARISYDFTDTINGYVNFSASSSRNANNFFDDILIGAFAFDTNAFLPASFAALTPGDQFNFGKEFDPTKIDEDLLMKVKSDTRYWQVNSGLTGRTGIFDWDLAYTHGESHATIASVNNLDQEKMFAALDAVINPANGQIVCQVSLTAFASRFPGCIPLNAFGPDATTAEMVRYLKSDTHHRLVNTLDDWSASVSGELFQLPAGPLRAAVSGEYRKQNYEINSTFTPTSLVDCTGLRICTPGTARFQQNVVGEINIGQNVWEVAGELGVPLLKDMAFVESLDLNLAARHTDYSTSGSVQTWKIGVDYHVNPTIRFRGTTSVDIRAPTLDDLYRTPSRSLTGYFDLHTGVQSNTTTSSSGNPNLVPEKAKTYTGGIVLTPSFIPGFNMAIDYYRITLNNAIANLGAGNAQIAQLCETSGGTADVCQLWDRPLPFADRSPANFPTAIYTRGVNAARTGIRGWDFEMNYRADLDQFVPSAPGNFSLRVLANHQPNQSTTQFTGAATTQTPGPKLRITTSVNYTAGPWRVSVTDRWLDSYDKRSLPTQVYLVTRAPSYNQVDLQLSRAFSAMGADMSAFIDVENLFNKDAPLNPTLTSNPGFSYPVAGFYPVLGRYFSIGLRGTF